MTSNVTYRIDWDAPMPNNGSQSVMKYEYSLTVNGMNMGSFDVYTNSCDITVPQSSMINLVVTAWDNYNQRGQDSTLSFTSDFDPVNLIPVPFGPVGNLRYSFVNFS